MLLNWINKRIPDGVLHTCRYSMSCSNGIIIKWYKRVPFNHTWNFIYSLPNTIGRTIHKQNNIKFSKSVERSNWHNKLIDAVTEIWVTHGVSQQKNDRTNSIFIPSVFLLFWYFGAWICLRRRPKRKWYWGGKKKLTETMQNRVKWPHSGSFPLCPFVYPIRKHTETDGWRTKM